MKVGGLLDQHTSPEAEIAFFRSLFRGREDVCPRRFESCTTGMISAKTVEALEARRWSYILSVRTPAMREAHEQVLADRGSYNEVFEPGAGRHGPAALKVKEVLVANRRYIVYVNEDQP